MQIRKCRDILTGENSNGYLRGDVTYVRED